jgi:hypothetical protein
MRRNGSGKYRAWSAWGVGGAAVAVIIAGLAHYQRATPARTVHPVDATEFERRLAHEKLLVNRALAAVEHQRTEVEQLREHVASLEGRLSTQRGLPGSHRSSEAQPADEPRELPTAEQAEAHEREVERAEVEAGKNFHSDTFEGEARDADWAAREESRVSQMVSGEAFVGTKLESIECRATRCRLVFAHESATGRERLGGHASRELFRYGGFVTTDPETHVTTVYSGREGHKFAQAALHRPGAL